MILWRFEKRIFIYFTLVSTRSYLIFGVLHLSGAEAVLLRRNAQCTSPNVTMRLDYRKRP